MLQTKLSDEYPEAFNAYEDLARDRHPAITHLIEVYERDGVDVDRWAGRPFHSDRVGELWAVDEDGELEAIRRWKFETRDTIGFDRDELARMTEGDD